MMLPLNPLRDKQQDPPTGYCARCGAELYRYDRGPLCPECERDESVDEKLKKIVDLARQLKEVVCDCPDVLMWTTRPLGVATLLGRMSPLK